LGPLLVSGILRDGTVDGASQRLDDDPILVFRVGRLTPDVAELDKSGHLCAPPEDVIALARLRLFALRLLVSVALKDLAEQRSFPSRQSSGTNSRDLDNRRIS
jgi:hypothetical protein